ncbi:MAG TPA: Ku protein [Dehalococcoidia bacterium]|nr:Ku protein [Dehalococcoidia bacterium]
MPRSIWNGVISFGMVSIPVRLFTATEGKDISFNLLHEVCGTRIKQQRWCPTCEREVPWEETARGYEYAKGQYVKLEDEDFEKLPIASKHTIELSSFVKAEDIDPIYYEKTYYLEPDDTGRKPFALLMRALTEKKLTAVAKIAIRNKERLCSLRPYQGVLALETMLYPDEIRKPETEGLDDIEVNERELQMAMSLIELLTEEEFDPSRYQDEYRQKLIELIEAKLEGVEMPEEAPAPARITDLMAALRASVEAAKARKDAEEPPAAKPARGRRRAAAG